VTDPRSAWATSEPEELADGLHRVPLPLPNDGLRAVNVYVLRTDDGLVLIDGGWALAESEEVLVRSLKAIGYRPADILDFLVTHAHRDHYTQAVALRRQYGSRISIGAGEQPNLRTTIDWSQNGRPRGNFEHLRRAAADVLVARVASAGESNDPGPQYTWELPDVWLADRSVVQAGVHTLEVIATPGHTAGHVVYHDAAAQLLFAGDHVLPQITPSIGFEPVPVRFPLRDYLDSLRLTLQLPDARLLPAHGPVAPSVHARVAELLDHHAQRLTDTERVVAAGAATGYAVAQVLTWTRRERRFADLDLFNQLLAVSETMAHLDVLALQGRVQATDAADGVTYFA
jgi:glyoxylase-like metal-dependent hydrolase (beta-lactamase superfamily II)